MARIERILPIGFAAIAAAIALSIPAAHAGEYTAAAKDLCKCREKPNAKSAEMMAAIQQAQATGDFSAMAGLQEEMMAMQGEIEACYEKLSAKYPHIAADDSKIADVEKEADKDCPNPARAMMGRGR